MSPFSLFKGKSLPSEHYIVCRSKADMYRIFVEHVKQYVESGRKVYVIYFFDDAGNELVRLLEAIDLSFDTEEKLLGENNLVRISRYNEFEKLTLGGSDEKVIFIDFHPMRSVQRSVLERLKSDGELTVDIYAHLDDELFERMDMGNIGRMLDSLGVETDEVISHKMVSNAMIKMQKKVEKEIANEKESETYSRWIELNLP